MSAGVIAAHYAATGSTFAATVMADSPMMYLKLDETAGATTAVDSSGNGHDVPAFNVTWGQASLLTAGTGTSATFNGTSARLSLSQLASVWMDSAVFTYEARIKWDGTQQWFGGRWNSTSHQPWLFWITSAGKLQLYTDGAAKVAGATTLVSGQTYTVACRSNGTTLQVFLNGASDGSFSSAGPTQTSAEFEVARASVTTFTTLKADEILFWTTALSDARLAAHHAAA